MSDLPVETEAEDEAAYRVSAYNSPGPADVPTPEFDVPTPFAGYDASGGYIIAASRASDILPQPNRE